MPEKPWERARQANPAATSAGLAPPALPASTAAAMSSSTTDLAGPPALPARSNAMGTMGATSTGYRPGKYFISVCLVDDGMKEQSGINGK